MQSKSFNSIVIFANCFALLLASLLIQNDPVQAKLDRKRPSKKVSSNNIEDPPNFGRAVCKTELCAQISSRFRAMGKFDELEPCQDFYKFTCGGYGGSIKNWAQEIVLSRLDDIFREIFDSYSDYLDSSNTTSSMKRLNSLYRSCMNRETGYESLLRILRSIGGFPLMSNLTDWNHSDEGGDKTNWYDLLLKMSPLGLDHNHFFSLTIGVDPKNTSSVLLKLGNLYIIEPDIEFVNNHLSTLTEIDPSGLDRDRAIHQLVDVKHFQQALFNISTDHPGDNSNKLVKMTVGELRQLAPRTDWLRFVRFIFESSSINDDEQILIPNEIFVSKLDNLLWQTNSKTLVNYIFLNIINDLKPELLLAGDGQTNKNSIQENCRQKIARELSFDLSSEYIRRFLDPSIRNKVNSLARYIQREIKFALDQSIDWVRSEQTKLKAKEKLDDMLVQVAFTNELINETILDSMFNGIIVFDGSDYLSNLLKLTSARRIHEASYLHKPYRALAWESLSRTFQVNAIYQPSQNTISLFAGQLTEAHYNAARPQFMNYATIGTTIGHELGHAFDPDCARRDQCGNLTPEPWWDEQTSLAYQTRVLCIEKLYDGLELASSGEVLLRINGTLTLNENLADITGYKLAYQAYKRWLKDNFDMRRKQSNQDSELRLPKMEQFNEKQLFWLSLANKRCDFDPPEKQARKFRGNSHSPEMFRVNIPLQNMKEFSSDFNCPLGSPMNPREEKCQLW